MQQCREVMQFDVYANAILFCRSPHLGTDNLVRLLRNMRADLRSMGGEIHFGARCVFRPSCWLSTCNAISHSCICACSANKFHIEGGVITGVDTICTPSQERGNPTCVDKEQTTKSFHGKAVVLATGHSARDVYYELHKSGVELEAKGFAVGFRVEHPQVECKNFIYLPCPR